MVNEEGHTLNQPSERSKRPWAYYRWPMIILALIGLQLLLGAITVYFATNDPSFAVETDAHAKGLSWDEFAAARQASDALGWSCELRVGDADPYGERYVFVTLADHADLPIDGAALTGVTYHQARGAQRLSLDFRQVTPGLYRAKGKLRRDGWWVFELVATRGDDRCLISEKLHVGHWRPQ